jgi:NAD(P)-dependent dehydrogenase (short-subunit alcohol dehydrogenase family)
MSGKTVFITGGTGGIGKATALALATLGARVGITGRDDTRTQAAATDISRQSGNPAVDAFAADLSSQTEVRQLAAAVLGAYPRLDVLVNNAGGFWAHRRVTTDGLEHTFAVNHLAPFLLTNLLRPKLTASAPARVITVSSDAHTAARLDLDDPNLEHGWSSWRSYSNSKLANILFTRELARRLDGTGVTANCLHPGVVRTGFGRDARPLMRVGITIAKPFMLSPERGADTIVYLASSPDVAGKTGGYYVKRQLREPSAAARDDGLARRLWEISERLTGLPASPAPAG